MKENKQTPQEHFKIGEKKQEIKTVEGKKQQEKEPSKEHILKPELEAHVEIEDKYKGLETKSDDEKNKPPESVKNIARFLRRHVIARPFANAFLDIGIISYILLTPSGRQALRNPEFRHFLSNRESRTGLLEDSIIAPELYFPNKENSSLEYRHAAAGRWIGYDFNRESEFGSIVKKKNSQIKEGRALAFPLMDIIDNPPTKYTPTRLLKYISLEHLLQAEFVNITELMNYGLVEETSYKEAYTKAGLYDKYRVNLVLAGVAEQQIYKITPKGNGLVFLRRDLGDKTKHKERSKVLKPALEFQ